MNRDNHPDELLLITEPKSNNFEFKRNKQIEEMEIALREAFKAYDNAWHECLQNKSRQPDREPVFYAKYLVEKKGYRKSTDVVSEIFKELIDNATFIEYTDGGRYLRFNAKFFTDHLLAEGVIVPPCKVGDTVYSIKATYSKGHLGAYWDEIKCDGCECTCDSHSTYSIQEETVIELSCGGRYWCVKTNKTNGKFVFISDTPYGRYLTREEAEKALERRANGN